MRTIDPSSPRLVWHGRDGRIELSGRVFDNWVAKSSNLLADELDAVEGTVIGFDLPVHWKTLALAFASWQTGGVVLLQAGPDGESPDVSASDVESSTAGAPDDMHGLVDADIVLSSRDLPEVRPPRLLVGVALGPLALAWDGKPLPSGAVDYAAEVRAQGDVHVGGPEYDAAAPLLRTGDRALTLAQLADASLLDGAGAADAAPTVLLDSSSGLLETLATACSVWARDGAIVLVEHGVPVTESLLAGERVTVRPRSS